MTFELSDPFTDTDLYGYILSQMTNFPTNWPGGKAESTIDATHSYGSLAKMEYRFFIPCSESNVIYKITYDIVTTSADGGQSVQGGNSVYITGTGSRTEPATSATMGLEPPGFSDRPGGGTNTVTVANAVVTTVPVTVAGSGPGDRFSLACSSCPDSSRYSTRAPSTSEFSAQFGMGQSSGNRPAGNLTLYAAQPGPALATAASLSYAAVLSEVEVIQSGGQLRQVRSRDVLADIVTINPLYKFEIRFYKPAQVGNTSNGVYQVSGAPFVTWTIENPDTTGASFNQLRLTETRGAQVRVYDYLHTAPAGGWKYIAGGGLSEEEVTTTTNTVTQTREVTVTTRKPGGTDVFKVLRKYRAFPWGEALVEETLSPDANPQTTTRTYYDVYSGSQPPLKRIVRPDGSWEFFIYDGLGRTTAVFSGWGDSLFPRPDELFSTNWGIVRPISEGEYLNGHSDRYRRTTYSYDPVTVYGSGDDGSVSSYTPRQTVAYLGNRVVSRSYTVVLAAEQQQIVCQATNAAWNAADNLVTITRYFTNGPNLGRVQSAQNPDGTMTFYDYASSADGWTTNTVWSGQPNANKTAIIDGTMTVAVQGSAQETVSRTSSDVVSGIILSREIYGNFDQFNRPQRVSHLDGTYEDTQYGAWDVESTTDRDSVLTQYYFDVMGRQTASRRLGITTTNLLDAAGNVLQTIRIGTNNSSIVLKQAAFDLAGRLTNEVNALNGVTCYTEGTNGSGQRIKTTTYPDNGIRVETYYLDGTLARLTGSAVAPVRYEYGADGVGAFTKEIKLNTDGAYSDTLECTTNYTDLLSRPLKTVYADGAASQSFYDSLGRLVREVDPDNVATLYQYNPKGEREYTAVDLNRDNQINLPGPDRITRIVSSVGVGTSQSLTNVRRTITYVWPDNQSTPIAIATNEMSTDGLRTWSLTAAGMSSSVTVYASGGNRYVTNSAPDSSFSVSQYQNGRLSAVICKDSTGLVQLSRTDYSYDPHGRQSAVTDARSGTTTYIYNNADQILVVTTPPTGTGQPAQTTTSYYNKMLQVTNVVQPDGTSVMSEYFPNGLLKQTYGSRTYPVAYTYDYAGRMKTMTTWRNAADPATAAVTTWNYNTLRGWLDNKRYADNSGPSYQYTPGGRLRKRIWARLGTNGQSISTQYSYGFHYPYGGRVHGDMYQIDYLNDPQSTPGVGYTLDRRGRVIGAGQGSLSATLAYSDGDQLLSESTWDGIAWRTLAITNSYDELLRRTNLSVFSSKTDSVYSGSNRWEWTGSGMISVPIYVNVTTTTNLAKTTYTYDSASRLQTVSQLSALNSQPVSATYSYLANSPLVGQIAFTNNGAWRMTTTKQFDNLNRLVSIASVPSSAPAISYGYGLNSANQRVRSTLADGSYWVYEFDALGQVKSGKKYWANGTLVAGQQFEYAHDDIGNRILTKAGGDQNGADLRLASYSANSLNQYTNRTVPGAVDVSGLAFATNGVTVNSQVPYRKGEYFRKALEMDNTSSPVWQDVRVQASGETDVAGKVFVPQTPESFYYDADGNLTNDGRWVYTWDAENRLIGMVSCTNAPAGSERKLSFGYDWQGRRVRLGVSLWTNSAWKVAVSNRFVCDGWNVAAELSVTNMTPIRAYTWGLDLSGSLQGAGGVGGLLAVSGPSAVTNQASTHFAAYDGNGNVVALLQANDGSVSARYEYGPFGELLRATGPMAKANPFRFSTKYQDDETDLLYYGYRYYNGGTGRWISGDPIGEEGGVNLYGFVGNETVSTVDAVGQAPFDIAAIPGIMVANGWNNGAALQRRWFSNPAVGPQLPDTTTIKMSWVLSYTRAKKVYDEIISQKLYANPAATVEIKKMLGGKTGAFGDFSRPVPVLDKESIQYRVVSFSLTDMDDLSAALGNFTLRVVVKGCATAGAIGITDIGIYVKDSFDFEGDQSLGYWNKATNYGGPNPLKGTLVSNSDYRAYSQKTGSGGDFLVFSDLMTVRLTPYEVIFK